AKYLPTRQELSAMLAYAQHQCPELDALLAGYENVNELVTHWARTQPGRIAFSGPGEGNSWRRVSWALLDEETAGVARGLVDAGVKPGDHVGILGEGDAYVDCLVAYLG